MFTFQDKNSNRAFRISLIDHESHHTPAECRQERFNPETLRFEIVNRHFFTTALDRQEFLNEILKFTRTFYPSFREKVESAPLVRTAPYTLELV
jgi:hypothetical protein